MEEVKLQKRIIGISDIFLLISIFLIALLISCDQTTAPVSNDEFIVKEFNLINLNFRDLPYVSYSPKYLDLNYKTDSAGVQIFYYNGKYYYHPVQLAQWIIMFVDSYYLGWIQVPSAHNELKNI